MYGYSYYGINLSGRKVKGTIVADTESEARSYVPPLQELIKFKCNGKDINIPFIDDKALPKLEVAAFFKQLHDMLVTEYSQQSALTMIAQYGSKRSPVLATRLNLHLSAGLSFSEACFELKRELGKDYSAQLRSAEESAKLPEVLEDLSSQIIAERDLSKRIRKSLISPIFSIILLIACGIIIFYYVVPKMVGLIESLQVEMPSYIMAAVNLSKLMQKFWYVPPLILVALITFFVLFIRVKYVMKIEYLKTRIPIIGQIFIGSDIINFYKYLGFSLAAGMPLGTSFESALGTVKNKYFRKELENSLDSMLNHGESIGGALSSSKIIPPVDKQSITISVNSGTLDSQLLKLAEVRDVRLAEAINTLSNSIGPIFTVFIYGMLGFLGMFLFSIVGTVTSAV